MVYPFFTRHEGESMAGRSAGDPGRFVDALESKGSASWSSRCPMLMQQAIARPRRHFPADRSPLRGDLLKIKERPADFGLRLIGSQDDGTGTRKVYAFAIQPDAPN